MTTTWNVISRLARVEGFSGSIRTWHRTHQVDPETGYTLLRIEQTDRNQDQSGAGGRRTVSYLDARDYVRRMEYVPTLGEPRRTMYDLDPLGQLLGVTQAGRQQQRNVYDLRGRLTSTTRQDAGTTRFTYDDVGNRTSQQTEVQRATGSRTSYSFSFNRPTKVDYPDSTPDVTLSWGGYDGVADTKNGMGRLVRILDGAKSQTLEYDVFGNVAKEAVSMRSGGSSTRTTLFDYDWMGRLGTVTLPDGEQVKNGYDVGGRLSSVTGRLGSVTTGYLPRRAYDLFGNVAYEELGSKVRTNYVRDPENQRLVQQITQSRALPMSDAVARVTARGATARSLEVEELVTPPPAPFSAVVGSQPVDVVGRRKVAPERFVYTLATAPATPVVAGARVLVDDVVQNLNYAYDRAGNVLTYDNRLPADTSNEFGGPVRMDLTYDKEYRLIGASGHWTSTAGTQTFAQTLDYDHQSGNLLRRRLTQQGATVYDHRATYSPDAQHRLATFGPRSFGYDANGNVTSIRDTGEGSANLREMTWDADNRMRSIIDRKSGSGGGQPRTFTYDYAGYLGNDGSTQFVNSWVSYQGTKLIKSYLADGQRIAHRDNSGKLYYLHRNLQRSTNVVTDEAGGVYQRLEYLPFGEVWVTESSNTWKTPYQYGSEFTDLVTGAVNFGQRWYDPRTHSFYGADPAPLDDVRAMLTTPTLAQSYTYANNNPMTYGDGDGRVFEWLQNPDPSPEIDDYADRVARYLTRSTPAGPAFVKDTEANVTAKLTSYIYAHSYAKNVVDSAFYRLMPQRRALQDFSNKFDMLNLFGLDVDVEDGSVTRVRFRFGQGLGTSLFDSHRPSADPAVASEDTSASVDTGSEQEQGSTDPLLSGGDLSGGEGDDPGNAGDYLLPELNAESDEFG